MRLHIADVQCSRRVGGAGRTLRHLRQLGYKFPSGNIGTVSDCPVPSVGKKENLPVRMITKKEEGGTLTLFPHLTRAMCDL